MVPCNLSLPVSRYLFVCVSLNRNYVSITMFFSHSILFFFKIFRLAEMYFCFLLLDRYPILVPVHLHYFYGCACLSVKFIWALKREQMKRCFDLYSFLLLWQQYGKPKKHKRVSHQAKQGKKRLYWHFVVMSITQTCQRAGEAPAAFAMSSVITVNTL